jgi:pyridoxal phosphate enzyme (YggS family)
MTDFVSRLADNLTALRQRIDSAARRAGRTAADITMVAVTKYVDATITAALAELGCTIFGESRPQDLWRKAEACADRGIHWHLIGHLQRNKVRRTLPLVSLIHSVDSTRLLEEIDRESAALQRVSPILLEVNISGDQTKHGLRPMEVPAAIAAANRLTHVELRGLMAMASREGDLAAAREDFHRLRELRDNLVGSSPSAAALNELSMGMSGDFEVAIEEGATLVRVGSLLFEGVVP